MTLAWPRKDQKGGETERLAYVHAEAGVKAGSFIFSTLASPPPCAVCRAEDQTPKGVTETVGDSKRRSLTRRVSANGAYLHIF